MVKNISDNAERGKRRMYFYNEDTGTLHIEGYCAQSRFRPCHIKSFDTEKEAYDFAGQKIFLCKNCQKKRDKEMKEGLK